MDIPANFKSTISDFINDLSITFPEYSDQWNTWKNASDEKYEELLQYCVTVYPERFFDILYQNTDIFNETSDINVHFLPNIDFKVLYNCDGVSDNTKQVIWKYLQLILFITTGSIKDRNTFGETANLFEGIDETELEEKLKSTMEDIGGFFKNMGLNADTNDASNINLDDMFQGNMPNMDGSNNPFGDSMPNLDHLQDHLKSLFDGKIGKLAKELADELSGDLSSMMGDMMDGKNAENMDSKDVFTKMMKNPKQMIRLIKTIGDKIQNKMKSGEISKDELMGEASELLSKMKEMGGVDQFSDVMKNFAGNMGLGKNAKINKNALTTMMNAEKTKERMRRKMEERKAANSNTNYTLETTGNKKVFRLNDEECQERSLKSDEDLIAWINGDSEPTNEVDTSNVQKKKKKKSKK